MEGPRVTDALASCDLENRLAKAEQDLQRYRSLFDTVDEAYAILEVVQDEAGRVADIIGIEFNRGYADKSCIGPFVGRRLSEFARLEDHWHDHYARVVRTGEPARIEHYWAETDSWLSVRLSRIGDPGSNLVAAVFDDITARKRTEVALRESDERQAFLLDLGDRMRAETDPRLIGELALRMLAEHLGADRCYFCELSPAEDRATVLAEAKTPDMSPILGNHHVSNFPELMRRVGEPFQFDDIQAEPRLTSTDKASFAALGMGSYLTTTLAKGENTFWALTATTRQPRSWSAGERQLLDLAAEKIWSAIDRARAEAAVRESGDRHTFLLQLSDDFRANPAEAAIGPICVEALARYMGVDRCYITAMSTERDLGVVGPEYRTLGLRPISGVHPYSDFPEAVRRLKGGEPMVVGNIANDPRLTDLDKASIGSGLGLAAILMTNLYEGDGNAIWALTVGTVKPRHWSGEDLRLVQEVGERAWAAIERARAEAALRKSELTLAGQREALEVALKGGPLEQSLGVLGRTAIALFDHGVRYAFYLANAEGTALGHVVGMSPEYAAEVEGFRIGADSLGSGLATFTGEPVLTTDVMEEPIWAPWRDMAARFDYRGCWSFPIHSPSGAYIGAFALYWREPRQATHVDARLAGLITQTAAIIIAREMDAARLRESEERFQQFAKASAAGLWVRDAKTLDMEFVSPAVETIYGVEPDAFLGDIKRWAAMIVPEDRGRALQHIDAARDGASVVHEFRIQRSSDDTFRWIRNTDFPLRDDHTIPRIGGIAEDVTEAKLAVEHQRVLVAELQHRVRNIMAMIRSMANRTANSATSVEGYRSLIEGRMLALARVQALLTREGNLGGSLRTIIESEARAQAHEQNQLELTGPNIMLSPKAVEVLTLAFHELATNAFKYGAFSAPDGRLSVNWSLFDKRGKQWLALDWREEGAPAHERSTRRGFGSELIEARIPYELGGTGQVTIGPGGAHCHLEFPLKDGESILETDAPKPTMTFGGTLDMTDAPDLSGRTVLIVEDDYYLAADTSAAIRGAGARVLGPCPTEETARELLAAETPSHAVLDLNLGCGPRFEIAQLLTARGIPFIFLTGYDPDVIPPTLADVPRLQKPVSFRTIVDAVGQLSSRGV